MNLIANQMRTIYVALDDYVGVFNDVQSFSQNRDCLNNF